MNLKNLTIRNDDVLQVSRFTKAQQKCMNGVSPFELFLLADEPFKKYNFPCVLSVLSEGIDEYPEWVDYIQKNKHRYIIELHGSKHFNYSEFSKRELAKDLSRAMNKIENTFNTKISTWYLPFGRHSKNPYGEEVCKELGIKYDVPPGKIDAKPWLKKYHKGGKPPFFHINFHYWCYPQTKYVEQIIEICDLTGKNNQETK